MGDIPLVEGGDGNDSDGAAIGILCCLFVEPRQIAVQRAGHGILRRNLVHLVGNYGQCVGVKRHIRKEYQHLLFLLSGKIFSRCKSHIWNEQAFNRWIFRGIDEGDDLIASACIDRRLPEIQVVVVGHPHTPKYDFVGIGPEGHFTQYAVIGLVRVCEEGYFLAGNDGIVEIDAGNAGGDELRGLLAPYRVQRRTSDFEQLPLNFRSPVDRVAVGVEKTPGK